MAGRLRGIFTPNMIPLDGQGRINEKELRRYVDWLIAKGVAGLYPNGSTGEFTRFTPQERRRIVQIVCEQAKGKAMVLAGAAEANVQETLAACEAYKEYGATAVAIVSPFYYRLGPESVYAYFAQIARESPIDITLYNIPNFASPLDVATVCRLADLPRIIGLKDSSADLYYLSRLIAQIRPRRPDFSFLCGWEAVLVPSLVMGADGGTNASSGVVPEHLVAMYQAVTTGRLEEAAAMQLELLEFFDLAIYGLDFPEGVRAGVELRGFDMGQGRQPLTQDQQRLRQDLKKRLAPIVAKLSR